MRGIETCPMFGQCLTKSLVYKAEVLSNEGLKEYLGQGSNTFKLNYNNHTDSCTKEHKKKAVSTCGS